MARFRVIREATRSRLADPLVESGWWILDESGVLTYDSLLPVHRADEAKWLQECRQRAADDVIFDYLDAHGGDGYFRLLGIPQVHQADDLDSLIRELKTAQNTRTT